MSKEDYNPAISTQVRPADSLTKSDNRRHYGELTVEAFKTKHSCSPDDAIKLKTAYLEMSPNCTHPLAICSAILTHMPVDIAKLTTRLMEIGNTFHAPKPTK